MTVDQSDFTTWPKGTTISYETQKLRDDEDDGPFEGVIQDEPRAGFRMVAFGENCGRLSGETVRCIGPKMTFVSPPDEDATGTADADTAEIPSGE